MSLKQLRDLEMNIEPTGRLRTKKGSIGSNKVGGFFLEPIFEPLVGRSSVTF